MDFRLAIFDWRFTQRRVASLVLTLLLASGGGCQKAMQTPVALIEQGEYGKARMEVREQMTSNKKDLNYLLDRMRVAVLTMDDGYPQASAVLMQEVYNVLRTQGVNEDKTVASLVFNEDLKLWKGEPYEQALSLAYYAMQQASMDSWDNARAAADNSLFYLQDLSGKAAKAQPQRRIDADAIAEKMRRYEAEQRGETLESTEKNAKNEDHGYAVVRSDFSLGYLLHAVASQQLGRANEANDYYNRVGEFSPAMKDALPAFRSGDYNFVFIVAWGLAPERVGEGLDREKLSFRNRSSSDGAKLIVTTSSGQRIIVPVLTDVNRMSRDHLWNALDIYRQGKSAAGNILVVAGAATTVIGANNRSWEAVGAGVGAMALGAILKAGAHADIRYLDVLPQRFYAAPVMLQPGDTVTMQIEGKPGSRMTLVLGSAFSQSNSGAAKLRYVRLVSGATAPAWATSGQVFYDNPFTDATASSASRSGQVVQLQPMLPYLFGGENVEIPSQSVLTDYQNAGRLRNMTLADLQEAYRRAGVLFTIEQQGGWTGLHLLEGGKSLVSPLPGTAGFTRIYGQLHPPYAGPK